MDLSFYISPPKSPSAEVRWILSNMFLSSSLLGEGLGRDQKKNNNHD